MSKITRVKGVIMNINFDILHVIEKIYGSTKSS